MSASRTWFLALPTVAWMLAGVLPAVPALAASNAAPVQLPAGARVGVVNLLDAEVTHFHSSRNLKESYLKTYPVNWPVGGMLSDAVRERLTELNIVPVPLAPTDALNRAREPCFLNANLAKALSKECAAPYAQMAAAERLVALIVLGPGLNDSNHAQGTRRKDLPEYLRGWCIVSGAPDAVGAPRLLNLTELVLVVVTDKGPVLADREWGGAFTQTWTGFDAATDLKAIPERQLDQLRPLFAALLGQQSGGLLGHLAGAR
jgi:hypothetical protein